MLNKLKYFGNFQIIFQLIFFGERLNYGNKSTYLNIGKWTENKKIGGNYEEYT